MTHSTEPGTPHPEATVLWAPNPGIAVTNYGPCLDGPRAAARGPVGRETGPHLRHLAGKAMPWLTRGILAVAACACLTGCFGFLKPARPTARYFTLTPLPATNSIAATANPFGVGMGQVKLPAYLFDTSLAVRKGTNEISYLPSVIWAERLDSGVQRVLAANLATLLPTDRMRLSTWRSEDVSAEVYVIIAQLEVDARGRGVLAAWWRVLSPGGEKTLKAGESHLVRQGPPPGDDPPGAIATLSELVADFSRQLAQALSDATLQTK